jgi:hypothetical protein
MLLLVSCIILTWCMFVWHLRLLVSCIILTWCMFVWHLPPLNAPPSFLYNTCVVYVCLTFAALWILLLVFCIILTWCMFVWHLPPLNAPPSFLYNTYVVYVCLTFAALECSSLFPVLYLRGVRLFDISGPWMYLLVHLNIVTRSLLGVTQYVVGILKTDKFLLCLRVTRISIWM